MRHRNRRSAGQALVEFALVIPWFLLMFFGLVDAGRLIYTYNTLANAARSAARVAIVNQSTSGTQTCDTTSTAYPAGCAISSATALALSKVDVSYQSASGGPCSTLAIGCVAVVTVTGSFVPITPIIGSIIGTITLQSTSSVPVERVCASGC
jgi:Flp pilus assembly protein TadG